MRILVQSNWIYNKSTRKEMNRKNRLSALFVSNWMAIDKLSRLKFCHSLQTSHFIKQAWWNSPIATELVRETCEYELHSFENIINVLIVKYVNARLLSKWMREKNYREEVSYSKWDKQQIKKYKHTHMYFGGKARSIIITIIIITSTMSVYVCICESIYCYYAYT